MCLVIEIFEFTAVSRLLLAFTTCNCCALCCENVCRKQAGFFHGSSSYYSYLPKNTVFVTFAFLKLTMKLNFAYVKIMLRYNKYPYLVKCCVADSIHAILKECSLNPNL